MKKILIGSFIKMIMGFLDAVLPNIKNSISEGGFDPVSNKQETKVDFIRLISSAIVFILLVLNFFGFIDIVTFVRQLIYDLSSSL